MDLLKLAVYNMLGEEVASIVNTTQKAGRYELNFNASNCPVECMSTESKLQTLLPQKSWF